MNGAPLDPQVEGDATISSQRVWFFLASVVALHIVASFSALALPPWQMAGVAIGVGDCQSLLAMLLGCMHHLSSTKQLIACLGFLLSGVALHYAAIANIGYPSAEDWLLPLMQFVAMLAVAFHESRNVILGPPEKNRWFVFSLSDLLVVLLAVSYLLVVAGIAQERFGLLRPWRMIALGTGFRELTVSRGLSLILALVCYGFCFYLSARLILTAGKLTVVRCLLALGPMLTLGIFEGVLGFVAVWLKHRAPWLPVGCWFPYILIDEWWGGRGTEFGSSNYQEWIGPTLLTVVTRIILFMISLTLIRLAGFRLAWNRTWPWKQPSGVDDL